MPQCLFQARIHPEVPAKALGPQRCAALLGALTRVCSTAVAADADSERFPADWLFHRRWGKKAGTTACGAALQFLTVGGRTSCFAPALQRKTEGLEGSEGSPPPEKKAPAPKKRAAAAAAEQDEAEEVVPPAAAPKRGKATPKAAVPRAAGRRGAAASAAAQLAAAAAGRLRLP